MAIYILDWLEMIVRWAHMITGIAWIGASFYFIWLDNSLQNPPRWKEEKGMSGDLWAIHGGGIYEVGKYKLSPPVMPETLHWFKWEAYTTWLSGMVLLTLVYYIGADAYLIDKRVADLAPLEAIAIGLGYIFVGWFIYDGLCNSPLAKKPLVLGAILLLLLTVSSYSLAQIYSGRGAYIHVGAMIGTMMVGNVFRVIMPSQRALVDAIKNDTAPDPAWGAKAKLRSTHNTYLTLPLLFIMISNHYPMTYSHEFNWLILLVITIITACVRQFFVLRHKNDTRPILLVTAGIATLALAILMAPPLPSSGKSDDELSAANAAVVPAAAEIVSIVKTHCANCHSANPTDDMFTLAPAGVMLDELSQIQQWAPRIMARTVLTEDMPFMNKTQMTEQERSLLGAWIRAGSPSQ